MKIGKQILSVLVAAVLLASLISFSASAEFGDANGDGSVDMKDVMVIRKFISGIGPCKNQVAADMNGDTYVDMKDVLLLRLKIAGAGRTTTTAPFNPAEAEIADMLSQINKIRTDAGLKPLSMTATLYEAADIRAKEMATNFSHTRPNGKKGLTILDDYEIKYVTASEQMGQGFKTATDMMNRFMSDMSLKMNIINPSYTAVGIGYDAKTATWVQIFVEM